MDKTRQQADDRPLWGIPAIAEYLGQSPAWLTKQIERGRPICAAIRRCPGVRRPYAFPNDLLNVLRQAGRPIPVARHQPANSEGGEQDGPDAVQGVRGQGVGRARAE